jgi:hypothetical protein
MGTQGCQLSQQSTRHGTETGKKRRKEKREREERRQQSAAQQSQPESLFVFVWHFLSSTTGTLKDESLMSTSSECGMTTIPIA